MCLSGSSFTRMKSLFGLYIWHTVMGFRLMVNGIVGLRKTNTVLQFLTVVRPTPPIR